jgi:hypothetical protein
MESGISRLRPFLLSFLASAALFVPNLSHAVGVTVITHGYDSDVNSWITAMANRMPHYETFPGTNFTIYKITLTTDTTQTNFFYQWSRTNGVAPNLTDSGEIIVKLDWSQMAGGSGTYDISTYNVATIASYVLSQTNAISELNGHALAEFPMHLIGHSRGGSLINEMSRQLGTNGLWVDQLTSLDPYPLNNDGNSDPFFPTDASASNTFVNVLFRDNYYQTLSTGIIPFNGKPASGAYNRHLTSLSGGYNNVSGTSAPYHSNVHLWYHGTVDWTTPTSDSSASITSSERSTWWAPYEESGTNTGFVYSLIGGADRTSAIQPLGPGFPAIRDGYNQFWDLGAGTTNNRTTLPANNGGWPNPIKFNRTDTGQVLQGQSISVKLYYQWAKPSTSNAMFQVYLDSDFNPLNSNQNLLWQTNVPASGASSVNVGTFSIPLSAANASPGLHSLFGVLSGGGRSRYLYAPELVQVVAISNQQPPTLDIAQINSSQFQIGVNGVTGQTIVLLNSSNLLSWQPLATNTLATSRWVYTNTPPSGANVKFYRATVAN